MRVSKEPRRVLLVIGHGKTESLCHHLQAVARNRLEQLGAPFRVQDLLSDGFDPVLRLRPGEDHPTRCGPEDPLLARYQEDVIWAEAYLVIHPIWWSAPPAILKGWVDRVLVDGVALRQPPGAAPEGILTGRRALVVQTFNAPATVDRVLFSNVSRTFWKRAVFLSAGLTDFRRLAFYSVAEPAPEKLEAYRERVKTAVASLIN